MTFFTPIHESTSNPMSSSERAGKNFINFCESYISFGRRCYVIQNKDNGNLNLQNAGVISVAQRILHIALSLLVLPLVVCAIVKGIHRSKVLSGVANINFPMAPPAPAAAAASFGPLAFEPLQENNFPNIKTISAHDFDTVLDCYPKLFQGYHPKNTHKTIRELISEAYFYGSLYAAANPQFADQANYIQKLMHVVINELDTKGAAPTTKQKGFAQRLHDAFRACQAVQYRTIQEIATELLSKGNLSDEVSVWWQEYKMTKLEELIGEKHPNSSDPYESDFTKQFDHIKSAYIVELGDEFGLAGMEAARRDKHRPTYLSFSSQLRKEFRKKLDLQEFARQIALDINNINKETSRLDKNLVFKWYTAGNCEEYFGFYEEGKNYANLPEATEEQKDDLSGIPFMSIDEAMTLLRHDLVGIAAP